MANSAMAGVSDQPASEGIIVELAKPERLAEFVTFSMPAMVCRWTTVVIFANNGSNLSKARQVNFSG